MQVRRIDVGDDAQMKRFHQITEVADTYQRPWCTQWSLDELLVEVRNQDESSRWELLGAFEDDEMVGAGLVILPLLDNVDKVYSGVFVEPGLRRQGIGSVLVDEVVATARDEGRSCVLSDTGVPGEERETHPYVAFARKHGFATASVEVHRVLDLPLPVAELEAMQSECAPHHRDYELRTFHDRIPDELLESYCYLSNQLALDAPSGDIDYEAEAGTPELYKQHMERMRKSGRHQVTTLAVGKEGEAVAVTDLVIPQADPPKVYQYATLVRRDHRGNRLGAAVKLQNLLALQETFPERTEIHTTNEETNVTMIGINERLGFRIVEVCPEFQLKLHDRVGAA